MAKGSIDKETDIVGVGGVDDVVAVNLQDSTCLQPGNGGFEDRLKDNQLSCDLATAE